MLDLQDQGLSEHQPKPPGVSTTQHLGLAERLVDRRITLANKASRNLNATRSPSFQRSLYSCTDLDIPKLSHCTI